MQTFLIERKVEPVQNFPLSTTITRHAGWLKTSTRTFWCRLPRQILCFNMNFKTWSTDGQRTTFADFWILIISSVLYIFLQKHETTEFLLSRKLNKEQKEILFPRVKNIPDLIVLNCQIVNLIRWSKNKRSGTTGTGSLRSIKRRVLLIGQEIFQNANFPDTPNF